MAVKRRISASRFRVGGAPRLAAARRNHHIVIMGARDIMPFVKYILRVLVDSYV
jgi:hypothetical protein